MSFYQQQEHNFAVIFRLHFKVIVKPEYNLTGLCIHLNITRVESDICVPSVCKRSTTQSVSPEYCVCEIKTKEMYKIILQKMRVVMCPAHHSLAPPPLFSQPPFPTSIKIFPYRHLQLILRRAEIKCLFSASKLIVY